MEIPLGPTSLRAGVSYDFSTRTTDPNEDTVRFGWDWDGDDIVDEVTDFVNSEEFVTTSHVWTIEGIYNIQVKTEDERGAMSDYSESLTVNVLTNPPPNKPTITGPTSGKAGKSYTYSAHTIDPDGDQIYYWFDWDDGTNSGWTGPYNSGQTVSVSHIWSAQGTYSIKVKAKDTSDVESDWSDPLSISMPKNKAINTPFLQYHQHMFPLLRQLLGL